MRVGGSLCFGVGEGRETVMIKSRLFLTVQTWNMGPILFLKAVIFQSRFFPFFFLFNPLPLSHGVAMHTSQCHSFQNYPSGGNRGLQKESPHWYNNIWSNKFTSEWLFLQLWFKLEAFQMLNGDFNLLWGSVCWASGRTWFYFNHFDLGDSNYKYHHGLWRKHWFYCYLPGLVSIFHQGIFFLGARRVKSPFWKFLCYLSDWHEHGFIYRTNWWICLTKLITC